MQGLNFIGIGKITHDLFNTIPVYNALVLDSREASSRPDMGRLAGVITNIQDKDDFVLVDFYGRTWKVHFPLSSTSEEDLLATSSTVRLYGVLDPRSRVFVARFVHAWEQ